MIKKIWNLIRPYLVNEKETILSQLLLTLSEACWMQASNYPAMHEANLSG